MQLDSRSSPIGASFVALPRHPQAAHHLVGNVIRLTFAAISRRAHDELGLQPALSEQSLDAVVPGDGLQPVHLVEEALRAP
jgi:hypothetical protein